MSVVVVGGGPAGVGAAVACARGGVEVVLLEGLTIGGEAVNVEEIDELPGDSRVSGPDFAAALTQQVLVHDIDLRLGSEATTITPLDGAFELETLDGPLRASAVILCSGSEPLPLSGRPALPDDPLLGQGLFTCAMCDGPMYAGRRVAVAGGGDTGVEAALTLSRYAARVALYERRPSLTAQPALVRGLADCGNVEVRLGAEITAAIGDAPLEAVEVSEGGHSETEPVDGLMLAVGVRPRTALVRDLVALDARDAVLVGTDLASSAPGIFAAGDVRAEAAYRCASAFGDGLLAAKGALAHVERAR